MHTRLRATCYLGLVFLVGALAGALAMNECEHRGWLHSTPAWANDRPHVMEQVKKELSLTPEQSRRMDLILDETMKQFQELHARSHEIRAEAKQRILALLNDEQKAKFEKALTTLQKQYGIHE